MPSLDVARAFAAEAAPHRPVPRLDAAEYRSLMQYWPSGVSVVATAVDGRLEGCTVSAFTSVGVEPPLVLVCLDNRSRTGAAVVESRRFSVNILCADQAALAERFAAPGVPDRFDAVAYRLVHDMPVLDAAFCFLVCDVYDALPASDHTIVLGAPIDGEATPERHGPLLFLERGWHEVAEAREPHLRS
jgi:flavin reductase (DIM6/NTAB) family NADH-FMN oxidoreductase RutF